MIALLGGRKTTLVLAAMILVALRHVIGLDTDDVELVVMLALGGSGAIALEDATTKFFAKHKTK